MKKFKIPTKVSRSFHKVGFAVKKHSPEILVVAGTVGVVTSAVMACKATTKASAILEQTKSQINDINEVAKNPEYRDQYTEKDYKKDITTVYAQTGVQFVKLYGPSVLLGVASLACIIGSHNILRKRNAAIVAAYATVDGSFKDYRKRVVERFGKELDHELKNNIKAKQIEETITNEDGTTQTVTTTVNVVNPNDHYSDYSRCFDETCLGWTRDAEYNLMFLRQQQAYANDKLQAQGYLYLNDVYKMLGIPASKAGQVVGWVYNEENPVGDNFVDFGIYDLHDYNKRCFVNGYEKSIWLEFNVDGVILDLMP